MSMDAGGLAQMTYNQFSSHGLGVPGAGFASRGKSANVKRLSLASPPKVGVISEDAIDAAPTPRTSRSHLLAGLRTAPKTPTAPMSAPYGQTQHQVGLNSSRYAVQNGNNMSHGAPRTAAGTGFNYGQHSQNQYSMYGAQQQQQNNMYSLPEQVLAPPQMQFEDDGMDPALAQQLHFMQQNLHQRQQALQQKLLELTVQQMSGMSMNGGQFMGQQQPITPMTPDMQLYQQYLMNGTNMSMPQEVPGQPGNYIQYNPLTGQYQHFQDPHAIQAQLASSPPPATPSYTSSPPKQTGTPTFMAQITPPDEKLAEPWSTRSVSPPKKEPTPPADYTPLPPPSANAFRRGHKKAASSFAVNNNDRPVTDVPKSAVPRPVGFPQTPMTGSFGPGQGRAGEHPVRQPRGPPPLDELVERPTTKYEGSKNFATRQRRSAVHSLVRAGMERRTVQSGSGGSNTPVSESEMTFSIPSDNDSDSMSRSSGSLQRRPSIGSLRALSSGAIGSERKTSRNRSSVGSSGSDEASEGDNRRKTPLLVLTSAEKRKSTMY